VETAFTELVVSKTFTEIPEADRQEVIFHWKILRKFLKSLEVPEPVTEESELGVTGLFDIIALNKIGLLVIAIVAGFLLFAFLAFGICKALSELVKNSYLQRKVLETKLLDEGYELEEIEEED
jgi:hypothetical protein